MTAIRVLWGLIEYSYYYRVEVHKSATDDLGEAFLVGTTQGNIYQDVVGSDETTWYYWARVVKQIGDITVIGPWNDTKGTPAAAAPDPDWILKDVEGKISDSHLNDSLSDSIDKIPRMDSDVAGNKAAIANETTARVTEDESLASSITDVQAEFKDSFAGIRDEMTVIVSDQEKLAQRVGTVELDLETGRGAIEQRFKVIDDEFGNIRAEYTVKLDVCDDDGNCYAGGFGLVNDGDTIKALWRVDTFAIGAPGEESLAFAVDNGRTVMDGAYIKNASITTAQIGELDVDRLVGGTADFVEANIRDGAITNLMIGNEIRSDNYSLKSNGWIINKDGSAEFHNIFARGRIDGSVIGGSLIDGSWFINPETESVVPTESDNKQYPRFLTWVKDYFISESVRTYDGNDRHFADYWVRTDKSPKLTCPVVSANYTGDGDNTIVYNNQNRFEKHRPKIVIECNAKSNDYESWCRGPMGQDDEPRQSNQVRMFFTIYTLGKSNINLEFDSILVLRDCYDNDGHAWPGSITAFSQKSKGFTLLFRYICPPGGSGSCHGRNQRYFDFKLEGNLPHDYFGNVKITADFYMEWRNLRQRNGVAEGTIFKNIIMGGQTRQ